VTVLRERYLIRDELAPVESTGEMMDRAANCVAAAEDGFRRGSSPQWAERFSILLRNLEFLPNSPTLMNAGTDLACSPAVSFCPLRIRCARSSPLSGRPPRFSGLAAAPATPSATCDPPGIGWPARAARPADRCRFFGCTTLPPALSRLAGRRRGACMAVRDASHPDIYNFVTTKAESPSNLTHFNLSIGATGCVSACRPTRRHAPPGQPPNRQDGRAGAGRRAVRRDLRRRVRVWRPRTGVPGRSIGRIHCRGLTARRHGGPFDSGVTGRVIGRLMGDTEVGRVRRSVMETFTLSFGQCRISAHLGVIRLCA
jgi:hypothetical protein